MGLTRRLRWTLALGLVAAHALVGCAAGALRETARARRVLWLPCSGPTGRLAFTPSGDRLLALTFTEEHFGDGRVQAWAEPGGSPLGLIATEGQLPTDVAVSPGGDRIALAHAFGEVRLRALPAGEPCGETLFGGGMTIGSNSGEDSRVRFSPSGQRLASNGVHGSLSIWSIDDHRQLNPAKRGRWFSEETIDDCWGFLGFVSEDSVAYATSGSLHIWSVAAQAVTADLPLEPCEPSWQFLSPRGTLWVSYPDRDPSVATIRAIPSGRRVGPPLPVERRDLIAVSPDDELVAVAGPRRVFIREVRTGRELFSYIYVDTVRSRKGAVAFSPTRDRLAVARGSTVFVFPFDR